MQPSEALAAPDRPVRAPCGTTGTRSCGRGAHDVLDLLDGARQHDDGRDAGLAEARHVETKGLNSVGIVDHDLSR